MAKERGYDPVAVVGAGLIGVSWGALFLRAGYAVRVYDQSSSARASARARIAHMLGVQDWDAAGLTVTDTLDEAVGDAALVHEAAPERVALKRALLAEIQRCASVGTTIASSTSSLRHSDIVADCLSPKCIVTAHPFNPPTIIPLVELFGIDERVVNDLAALFRTLGKTPVVLRKEMTGHIANRLSSALWREALYLLQEGVASAADIDRAVTAGPGLRWAIQGPFMTYHLGGGHEGIEGYLYHLGESQVRRWRDLGEPRLDAALTERIVDGVYEAAEGRSIDALTSERDEALRALLTELLTVVSRRESSREGSL